MNQGVSTSVQAANPLASNANMGVNKSVVSTAFVKKSLKLTPKQIEEKRKKKTHDFDWNFSPLSLLDDMSTNEERQFGSILILQRLFGEFTFELQKRFFSFSFEDKGSYGGRIVMMKLWLLKLDRWKKEE